LVAGEHSAEYFALDDAGRRRRGIPRVDKHLYARETAWMANALVEFPELDRPAAFVCANGRCSLPAFTPEELRTRIARLRSSAQTP
jgi:hypothetical protein